MVKISNDLQAYEVLQKLWATTQPDIDPESRRALEHLILLMEQQIGDSVQIDYVKMLVQQSIDANREIYGNQVNADTLNQFVTRNGFYEFKSIGINARSIAFNDMPKEHQEDFKKSVADSGYSEPFNEDECGMHQYQLVVDDKELVKIEGLTNDFIPYTNSEDIHHI